MAPTVGTLALLFLVGSVLIPGFLSGSNIVAMLVLGSFLGIAAAGQTLVIVLGGIDLSVASTVGLGEVVTAVLYSRSVPLWEILVILLLCGIIIGILNGGISSYFKLHPLIVTLGVGFIISGTVLMWTNGGAAQGTSPAIFQNMTSLSASFGPIPLPPIVMLWALLIAVVVVIQRYTMLGRQIYSLGSSAAAAKLALVPRVRTWIITYVISALTGIMAGVVLSGFSGGANFSAGDPYLFNSIAAVVVGGTSLLGGRGGYARTVIGSLIVTELTTILLGFGLNSPLQETLLGVFIILVVAIGGREAHVRSRV
jgi:ribose transport system permease protein